MIRIILLIFLTALLTGCQSSMEGFTLKDKKKADEFLVEKKNPLILPPNYGSLPTPNNTVGSNAETEDENFQIIVTDKSSSSTSKNNNENQITTSTQENILKNIKRNEAN